MAIGFAAPLRAAQAPRHCALLWLVIGSTNAAFAYNNNDNNSQYTASGSDPAGVAFLPHFASTQEVSEVLDQVQAKCNFVENRNHWAKDCKLPVATETMAKLAERLLATVIPNDCKFETKELPVRQFDADIPEGELHSDAGPSWTLLVHLSDGATCFAESENASQDGESGQCHLHSPGDVAIWWNNGVGPAHGTRLLPEASNKLVLNIGVFATSFSKCHGLHINSAGIGSTSTLTTTVTATETTATTPPVATTTSPTAVPTTVTASLGACDQTCDLLDGNGEMPCRTQITAFKPPPGGTGSMPDDGLTCEAKRTMVSSMGTCQVCSACDVCETTAADATRLWRISDSAENLKAADARGGAGPLLAGMAIFVGAVVVGAAVVQRRFGWEFSRWEHLRTQPDEA